jgi:S1-C subfamily serine protease
MGEVTWLDYHANLALVTVSDEKFWSDLKAATFGSAAKMEGPYQIVRWREGKLENRRAEFSQFTVRDSQLCPLDVVTLETSSDIQGVGWGEPLVANSRVVGILWAQDGRTCVAMPASFIQSILEARKKGEYHGLGYFHFFWQPSENPASLERLKLPGEPRGVVVIDVPERPDGGGQVLKPLDVILRIDGFDLDIQGDYTDPEFGPLLLENLATRRKWAGDDVKMQIWRDGKQLGVTYRLPKFEYTNSLVPAAMFDKEPEYMIVGGLVFQPLTESYLAAWGNDWKRRAPFRLNFYRDESPSKERPALVLLSQVLPDGYNIGYQEQRYLVVDKVNGQPVHRLAELQEALQKATNNVHIIEFMQGDSLRRMVLAAGDTEREATARVLKRYGITDESRFADAKN